MESESGTHFVDTELIERARALSSSAALVSKNLDISQARYIVSRSIEVKEKVKTPRRDIRTYLNDDTGEALRVFL